MAAVGDSVPQGRIRRALPLAGFTARAAGQRLVAELREMAGDPDAVARFHARAADHYAQLLGHSKGVLMKAGQLFSTVDTNAIASGQLTPYQKALARLQADAPPMDPTVAGEVLRADLGARAEQVFAEFDAEPFAAASIGQVHRAVLRDGRDVAVKIQYPGVAEAIRADLANTELLTTFFRFLAAATPAPMPDTRQATRDILARITEEVDYRHEAANITAFGELYRDHPFIRIPEVVSHASGERVLTMTYMRGMDWAAAQEAEQELKNTWAEVILRFTTSSYRHANLFHGDPHPGNYRFGPDGQVGFLDFGCVKVLPETLRRNVVGLLRAAVEGRKRDLRDMMVDIGFFTDDAPLTADEVYGWYADLVYEVLAPQPVTYSADIAQRAVRALIDYRSADHPVRRMAVPEDLALTSRINLSVTSICAALRATVHVRATLDDLDGVAAPVTPLGKQHDAWARDRGLPYGLDRHDRP
ncbi:MAG TPA: AarF/ABC1/UbiB kinase family protein [Mycobacterium sp.]|nr:AarF/ABC1/UbiB kinase family protein [Mycobacterium sp.]